MSDPRSPTSVWDDIKSKTDIPEPGVVTDMAGCGVEGEAEPLPEGDADRDYDEAF